MNDLPAVFPVFAYQTRIHLQPPQNEALEAYAELYGKVERTLFAATETGIDATDLKREYQLRFGITARQFNAIGIELKGKVSPIEERRPQNRVAESEVRIRTAEKQIARLEKTRPGS